MVARRRCGQRRRFEQISRDILLRIVDDVTELWRSTHESNLLPPFVVESDDVPLALRACGSAMVTNRPSALANPVANVLKARSDRPLRSPEIATEAARGKSALSHEVHPCIINNTHVCVNMLGVLNGHDTIPDRNLRREGRTKLSRRVQFAIAIMRRALVRPLPSCFYSHP